MFKVFFTTIVFFSLSLMALSPEIKFDMLKLKLSKQLQDKQYQKSLITMQKIKELNIKTPNSFVFFEAKALYDAGYKEKAYKKFNFYAQKFGRESRYYNQTLSYLLEIEETFLKQKGISNASDIFIDKKNNLMWQDTPKNKNKEFEMYWNEANLYCENLNFTKYSDWYLPNKEQLVKLTRKYKNLKFVSEYSYWSSSIYENDKSQAWLIRSFSNRYDYKNSYKYSVRCVRNL
jgi:hypothetical protein